MITRRNFIRNTAAVGAAISLFPFELFAGANDNRKIGIQLKTLRNLIDEDFKGTLKKIAKIGYQTIEADGYNNGKFYGYSPQEFAKITRDSGLIPLSSQCKLNLKNINKTVEDTLKADMKYLVLPNLSQEKRRSVDDLKKFSDELNQMGSICIQAGLTLAYHNHDFEFHKIEKQVLYEIIIKNTDPELVTMELDIYWMVFAGHDPLEYFARFPGRFKLWHVKDMADTPDKQTTEIGSGVIDFPALFENSETAGLKHYFIEQESFTIDPMESIKQSFQYLNSI